jgi:hypothetical protein
MANFIRQHNRKPSVLRLGQMHVDTLRACGAMSTEMETSPTYEGIPIEIVKEPLHLSMA